MQHTTNTHTLTRHATHNTHTNTHTDTHTYNLPTTHTHTLHPLHTPTDTHTTCNTHPLTQHATHNKHTHTDSHGMQHTTHVPGFQRSEKGGVSCHTHGATCRTCEREEKCHTCQQPLQQQQHLGRCCTIQQTQWCQDSHPALPLSH